jgi:hypothetical protein
VAESEARQESQREVGEAAWTSRGTIEHTPESP